MRIAISSRKRALPLALLLLSVTTGCYALRNMAGGMKSIQVTAPVEHIKELTLIVAKGDDDLSASEYSSYDLAVMLVEPPRSNDWLNFYQFIPPTEDGGMWSLLEPPGQDRYVHLDDVAIESLQGDLEVTLRFERWNLQHDDEGAQILLLGWFSNDNVVAYRLEAGDIRAHSGAIRVDPSGIRELSQEAKESK